MHVKNHTQLTAIEKLEDKFDDIIADLLDKINDLEYNLDASQQDIYHVENENSRLETMVHDLKNKVSELESPLDTAKE